jgi:basic amino acid/polyamine antiporter, APA family
VLRREEVEHEHFRAPGLFPVLGALVSVALIVDTALDDIATFGRAVALLAVGVGLWLVNRLASR